MLIDFFRVLLWILLTTLVASIEYSTGLPILTIFLILLAITGFSTIWFIFFVTVITAILSALFLESWLLVWLIVMTAALLFRMPSYKSRKTFLTKISIIVLAAIVLSMIRQPTITISFLIHTAISLGGAAYLQWRKTMPKHQGFDVADLRFRSE